MTSCISLQCMLLGPELDWLSQLSCQNTERTSQDVILQCSATIGTQSALAVCAGDQAGNIRVWDLAANACSCELVPEVDPAIRSIFGALDSSHVIAANNAGQVILALECAGNVPWSHAWVQARVCICLLRVLCLTCIIPRSAKAHALIQTFANTYA